MALKKIPGVVVEPLVLPTYLAFIEASIGTELFQNFWASVNGKKKELTGKGNLSCAFFVTTVLKVFNLVQEVQVTNNRALRDMEHSGWFEIPRPRTGCIVVWSEKDADAARMRREGGTYQSKVKHCGFYLSKDRCVNTGGEEKKTPRIDPLDYRPVEKFLWHPALEKGFSNPSKPAPKRAAGIYWHPNK